MHKLIKCYYEEHRFYHTFDHIKRMFDVANKYNLLLTDEQSMAIFYHDAYYDPGFDQNEELSAKMFMDYCFNQKAVSLDAFIVRQIILDTKLEISTINESKLVIDLDLYDLGTDRYENYKNNIRKEFYIYSDEEFRQGRVKWIESFLAREKIYISNIDVFVEMEEKARRNLSDELQELDNG